MQDNHCDILFKHKGMVFCKPMYVPFYDFVSWVHHVTNFFTLFNFGRNAYSELVKQLIVDNEYIKFMLSSAECSSAQKVSGLAWKNYIQPWRTNLFF